MSEQKSIFELLNQKRLLELMESKIGLVDFIVVIAMALSNYSKNERVKALEKSRRQIVSWTGSDVERKVVGVYVDRTLRLWAECPELFYLGVVHRKFCELSIGELEALAKLLLEEGDPIFLTRRDYHGVASAGC
jgi:hypothetical protein